MRSPATWKRWLPGAEQVVVAVLGSIAAVACSFAVAGLTRSFVVAPVNRLVTDAMPGPVVAFAIVVLGDLGRQLGVAAATALTVGVLAVPTLVAFQSEGRYTRAGLAGLGTAGLAALLTGALPQTVVTGAPVTVVVAATTNRWGSVPSGARRRLLKVGGGVLGLGVVGAALGAGESRSAEFAPTDPEVEPMLAAAEERTLDIDGMDGLLSDSFYEVDINSFNPVVGEDWSLEVTGAVEETTFTLEQLQRRETERRFETLRCVGESLNGHKMDTAVWTGTPVWPLLESLDVPENCCVMLRAADGYFEEFPLSALEGALLSWGMNGKPLPRRHGHPVRALVPGHWGEISVKWITEIEILETEAEGYWEKRGWHGTGPVETVAKLHAVNDLEDGRTQVGGHAYAGTRGVETVEVSTDGGETWVEATLSEPLPGEDVWRQWEHVYDPPDGGHEVVVRATDGDGNLQPREPSEAFPSGPTGWVSRELP